MDKDFDLKIDDALVAQMASESHAVSHDLLKNPDLSKQDGINHIFSECLKEYNEATLEQRKKLESLVKYLENIKAQKKQFDTQLSDNNKTILQLETDLKNKTKEYKEQFPKNLQDKDYIMDDLDNDLKRLDMYTGFIQKMLPGYEKKRKNIKKLYSEIEEIQDKIRSIKNRNKITETEINRLNIPHVQEDLDRQRIICAQEYEKANKKMHRLIADFVHAYAEGPRSRKRLLQNVPAILGVQYPQEPITVIQTVMNVKYEELKKLLENLGLKVGDAPGEYTIFKDRDGNLALMTPFYSPDSARTQIIQLFKYLAAHGVSFQGAIKPLRHYQLDPSLTVQTGRSKLTAQEVLHKIQQKLEQSDIYQDPDSSSDNPVIKKYRNSPNYLFRGQTFMTSDPRTAFSTMTNRSGAFGAVYGSDGISYASGYAGFGTLHNIPSGHTVSSDFLPVLKDSAGKSYHFGFLSVYKRSKKNLMFGNLGLESIEDAYDTKNRLSQGNFLETQLNPEDNPLVERYLTINNQFIKIDENDPEWKDILDFFAPNMNAVYGTNVRGAYMPLQNKMQKLRQEYASNDGKINTYDFTPEQIHKMGMQHDKKSFIKGIEKAAARSAQRTSQYAALIKSEQAGHN